MEQLKNIPALLESIRSSEGDGLVCDEEAIANEYQSQQQEKSNLAIKVLSIFGGLLAALAFTGFLAILGVYDSETAMVILGVWFIASGILLARKFDKLIIDTFAVALFILGLIPFIVGLKSLDFNDTVIVFAVVLVAFLCLLFSKNYILTFISVIVIGGAFLVLIALHDVYDAVHLYIVFFACLMTYVFLNEAKLLADYRTWTKFYDPIRIGLVFCFLFGLIAIGKKDLIPISQSFIWVSSIVIMALLILMVSYILSILEIESKNQKVWIYTLCILTLLPILFAPSISGALLLILLSFKVSYKTGVAIGAIALIYFVVQYYYDLSLSLLIKSIILFASGVVFLLLYLYISKKFKHDEKV